MKHTVLEVHNQQIVRRLKRMGSRRDGGAEPPDFEQAGNPEHVPKWFQTDLPNSRPSTEHVHFKSAKFNKINVLDVLDATNFKKSTKEGGSISTRALETVQNPVSQHFRACS